VDADRKTNNAPDQAGGPQGPTRRMFLLGVKRWSSVVAGLALAGVAGTTPVSAAWINRGGWINQRGFGGAGWINGAGGWVNRVGGGGGWVNRVGGGGGWVNRRGLGGGWINRR
jgi:hypothetical protein